MSKAVVTRAQSKARNLRNFQGEQMTGDELKTLRHTAGYSRPNLAAMCGLHADSIKYWENKPVVDLRDHAVGKTRCKFHGGMSTGPKTAEGRERIAAVQRKRWARQRIASRVKSTHPPCQDSME